MSTALYRRYRPEAFDEVIGQEHVTRPLSAAIDAGRINHAFLFSGPRGCGKTTSARILARCLNCAEGPTSNPCGQCPSCQDLANGGAGSLDVVEIDAASHNGVDDARDLRERAVYAPARDRFKVFILDEAHMVTTQGFNALLKLVEEPPAHVKFVFATTEPDKVIQTIRSRTHHYPFRLVPPETLVRYLDDLSGRENVNVGRGVLPLVVRAGGGSVRDTLSVLDQLMAGADDEGVDYSTAVALLGYTDDSLLGDIVDSFSAGDGAGVFRVIDRVVESGHDPRRFVEDLLERFRDLFVISAAEDAAASFLPEVPADRLERLKVQARAFGPAELSRAADLLNVGLTEMTGATSPRLQLELICARILLPGAEDSRRSVVSRVDRLERRIGMSAGGRIPAGAVPAQAGPEPVGTEAAGTESARTAHAGAESAGTEPAGTEPTGPEAAPASGAAHGQASSAAQGTAGSATAAQDADPFAGVADAMASARSVLDARPEGKPRGASASAPAEPPRADQRPDPRAEQMQQAESQQRPERTESEPPQQRPERTESAEPSQGQRPVPSESQADAPAADQQVRAPQADRPQAAAPRANDSLADVPEAHASPEIRQAPGVGAEIDAIRRGWPDVLARLQQLRKLSYAIVSGNSFPQRFDDGVLFLGFSNPGSVQAFRRGPHAQFVSSAVEDSLGIRAEVRVGDENAGPPSAPPAPGGPQSGGHAGQGGSGSGGAGQGAAVLHDRPGPRQVTQEELDSVVGPREADRAPVDHERYWQSDSADQSGAVQSGAPTSQPPSPRGREGRDDAEGDSRTPLTGADAERDSREPSADVPGAATVVAAEQSVTEQPPAVEPPASGPAAPETSASEPAVFEASAAQPAAFETSAAEPADSEPAVSHPARSESAGSASADQTQAGAAETAATRATESADASADAESMTSAPKAAGQSDSVQSAQDPWASDPWAPEAGYESWSGGSTQDDEPVATAAGDRAVDFGAVLVPPPVDIEPYPEDGEYPDEYADPRWDAPPEPVEEASGHGLRDVTGSDPSADREPTENQSPVASGDLDFLGAYADVDISFTENPGHAQTSRTAEPAASADSPLGRYANLAQRHSGDVKGAGQPAPPIEEHVPDPVENYTDYDTEGDADIEHDDEYGPAVVERILGGVIIEELNE